MQELPSQISGVLRIGLVLCRDLARQLAPRQHRRPLQQPKQRQLASHRLLSQLLLKRMSR